MKRWLMLLALALAGCAGAPVAPVVRTVEVKVPVPVRREPLPELMAPYRPAAPLVFVAPGDPKATSALTPEGEKRLRDILEDFLARDRAWQAWARQP